MQLPGAIPARLAISQAPRCRRSQKGVRGGKRSESGGREGETAGKELSQGFLSRFASRRAFGDFNRFNCFFRVEGLWRRGPNGGDRKIDEGRIEKKRSHCWMCPEKERLFCGFRNDNKIVTRLVFFRLSFLFQRFSVLLPWTSFLSLPLGPSVLHSSVPPPFTLHPCGGS